MFLWSHDKKRKVSVAVGEWREASLNIPVGLPSVHTVKHHDNTHSQKKVLPRRSVSCHWGARRTSKWKRHFFCMVQADTAHNSQWSRSLQTHCFLSPRTWDAFPSRLCVSAHTHSHTHTQSCSSYNWLLSLPLFSFVLSDVCVIDLNRCFNLWLNSHFSLM